MAGSCHSLNLSQKITFDCFILNPRPLAAHFDSFYIVRTNKLPYYFFRYVPAYVLGIVTAVLLFWLFYRLENF